MSTTARKCAVARHGCSSRGIMIAIMTALGFDLDKMHEEQQVWAFVRTMHQGTQRGVRALFTGTLTAFATVVVRWLWWMYGPRPR